MSTPHYPGRNVSAVKSHNTRAILLHLLNHEPAYRVRLAQELNISVTTVTKLTDELIEAGIISEHLEDLEGPRSVGRPQAALMLNRRARCAIGVHIGGGIFRVALVDLRNHIIEQCHRAIPIHMPVETVAAQVIEDVRALIQRRVEDVSTILGVGVGAPGLVSYPGGEVGFAMNQGWRNAPLGQMLRDGLGLPMVVENNVRAMALGEAFFGAGREVGSLLFVYGRLGVGAGLVVNRQIHRGIHMGAGEIGHTYLMVKDNETRQGKGSRPGQTLEELVSAPALVRQAQQAARRNPGGLLANLIAPEDDHNQAGKVFEAARAGDSDALRIIQDSALYLGMALVNAVNFINPELILLGGLFAQEQAFYLPAVTQAVRQFSFAGLGDTVSIQPTSFGSYAGICGAGALALTHFFYLSPEGML